MDYPRVGTMANVFPFDPADPGKAATHSNCAHIACALYVAIHQERMHQNWL